MTNSSFWRDFLRSEAGTSAIEYALVGSLLSLLLITGAEASGIELADMYQQIATGLN